MFIMGTDSMDAMVLEHPLNDCRSAEYPLNFPYLQLNFKPFSHSYFLNISRYSFRPGTFLFCCMLIVLHYASRLHVLYVVEPVELYVVSFVLTKLILGIQEWKM